MADQIVVSFDFPGVEEGERAVKMLSSLQSTLKAGTGAGKSLEELRKILVGMKGQGSVLQELKTAVLGLNTAAATLKSGFASSIGNLGALMKSEFTGLNTSIQTLANSMKAGGTFAGESLGTGLKAGLDEAETSMTKRFKSISAKAKLEATKLYQNMVANQPNAKVKDMGALFQLKEAGATLSPYHQNALNNWVKSSNLTLAAIKAQLKHDADQIIAANKAEQARIAANIGNTGMRLGGNEVVGQYSDFNALRVKRDKGGLDSIKVKPEAAEVDKLGNAFKKLTIDGNDAHSMARGLASGFNLLWLTWGNLLPLFAGAGVSFGLKKTFDIGSEVEYQIKMMEVLGQTTQSEGKVIRQELRAIDQETQFSLIDLTKAMVDLQQAGRTAGQALAMMRPSAALAALGQTDLTTATNVLNSALNAFGLGADKSSKVAAQIFNATKMAPLTISDIGEAIKYASEVNVGYGQSLSEVLTVLGSLSKVNIRGSSGGTSIINFMRDIAGRSGPAIKALDQLRKSTGDSIKIMEGGKFRPMIDSLGEIGAALKKLDPEAAVRMIQKMTSDRGIRSYFATMLEGTGTLREFQKQIEASTPEDMFKGAKGLMDTTKGALDILGGALVGALDQVFEAHADKFKAFIVDLTAAISSEAFKTSVYGMVQGVMTLYEVIKTLLPYIVTLGSAWAVFKVVGGGVAIFQGLALAMAGMAPVLAMTTGQLGVQALALITSVKLWEAKGAAVVGSVAASKAAALSLDAAGIAAARAGAMAATGAGGMRLLAIAIGFVSNPVVGVITTLALLGSSWWMATKDAEGAMGATSSAVLTNGGINIAQWNKEIATLRERNALMGDSYSGKQAEVDLARQGLAAKTSAYAKKQDQFDRYNANANPQQKANLKKTYDPVMASDLAELQKIESSINTAQGSLDEARAKDATEKAAKDLVAAKKAEAALKAIQGKIVPTPTGGGGSGSSKGGDPFNKAEKAGINYALEEIRRVSSEKVEAFTNAEKLMEASRSNGYIGDKEYYTKKMQFVKDIAKEQESALEQEIAARKAATFGGVNAKADSLANQAEIVKTQAKLAKTHTDNTTNLAILGSQADESFKKIVQGYSDAQYAAEQFFATLKRSNGRELAGYGMGSEWRTNTSANDSTKDKYEKQVKDLERMKETLSGQTDPLTGKNKYTEEKQREYQEGVDLARSSLSRELADYAEHTAAKKLLDADWRKGQSEAIANYQSDSRNLYKQVESVTGKALQGMEDAMVSFVTTGKADFKSLAASIIADIARIIIKQQISNALGVGGGSGGSGWFGTALSAIIGGATGGTSTAASSAYSLSSGVDMTSGFKLNALGNVYSSPNLSRYSGQILDTPTTFAFAKGAGLMAEAGPEAILPLSRGANGKLGVQTSGGSEGHGAINISVTVDASSTKAQSDGGGNQANQLGAMIGNAVRGILIQEKRSGGLLA